jgi:intein-encoded DNA endonuclease-like protein
MSKIYAMNLKEQAIKLYLEGLSANKVAKIIGANEATIRTWLKDSYIDIRACATYNFKHDKYTVEKIISMYTSGLNTPEIDKELKLKRGIASHLLRENNIKLRHRGPKSKIGNEDFFDIIDNEEKAYFLGWIIADGNISITKGQHSLKLHIALRDKEIIDKFLIAIESNNKTKIKEGEHPSYYVSLTSIHMCNALMELGVIPQKSGKEIFPVQIPSELYHHLIRGIFDGDGITDIIGKRSGFVGSKNIIENILKNIDESNRTITGNKKNNDIYYFLGGKKFSRKLYNYMHGDAKVWLSRKRQRLEEICSK